MLAAQMLLLLLHKPTYDSVEIAVSLVKEVGMPTEDIHGQIALAVYERFRNDQIQAENRLNIHKYDSDFEANDGAFRNLKAEILGEVSGREEDHEDASDESSKEEEDQAEKAVEIKDQTYTDLVNLRRSSLRAFNLNEDDTTSSSRIFIKRLIERLATCVGMKNLTGRLRADELQPALAGMFPTDNPKNTGRSINFFTAIGMGVLTEG
ncbi:hypothetical protein KC356_g8819, partial [Hortaea werneckii]